MSSPVTLLCSSPALPSQQPLLSPAGRGRPSTWTGPFLLPGSERLRPGTWPGWLDCRHGRSDELPPKRKKKNSLNDTTYRALVNSYFDVDVHRTHVIWGPSAPDMLVITWIQWIDRFWYNIIGPIYIIHTQNELFHTTSPIKAARFGATWLILERRYSCSSSRYAARDTTRLENLSMLIRSIGEMSIPGEQ